MSMESNDLHWLAGLLEGEGSFLKGPPSKPNACAISIQSTDEDVLAHVSTLLGVRYHRSRARQSHHKDYFSLHKRGQAAGNLMRELRPLMSRRRRDQIDAALASQRERHAGFKLSREEEHELVQMTGAVKDICQHFGISAATYFRIQARHTPFWNCEPYDPME